MLFVSQLCFVFMDGKSNASVNTSSATGGLYEAGSWHERNE